MRGMNMARHAVGAESVLVETVQIFLWRLSRSSCRNCSDLLVETVQNNFL